MYELTDRQIKLLKAIIEEYIDTAEPVGSETLDKKFNLGVSPATIRNEMVKLTKDGFLKQPHASAGRVPTPVALKFYIQNLMQQEQMSVTDEVFVKQKIWDFRQRNNQLLREATRALAEKTHTLAIATSNDGDIFYAGASYLLDAVEFYDMILTKQLLAGLDRYDFWDNLFGKSVEEAPFHVIFGEDLKQQYLVDCGMVYSAVSTPRLNCTIGVIGPIRLRFAHIIPVVSYVGQLLGEITNP